MTHQIPIDEAVTIPSSKNEELPGGNTPRYIVALTVVVLLAYAFVSMDNAFLGLALPEIIKDTNWNVAAIGYVVTGGFAMAVIAGLIVGPLADKYGRRRLIQIVMLFTGIFSGLTAIVGVFWQFAVVRFLSGTALAEGPLGDALLAEEAPPRFRGLLIGIAQAGNPLGNALAGMIAVFVLPAGWRWLFVVAFLPALFGVLAFNFVRESKSFQGRERVSKAPGAYRSLAGAEHRLHFGMVSVFMFFTIAAFGILLVFGPLYMTELGKFTPVHAAAVFAGAQWAALVAQIAFGWLSDRFPGKWLMFLCVAVGALSLLSIPMVYHNTLALTAAIVVATFFIQGTYGVVPRYMADSFPTAIRASAISIGFAFANVALIIVPSLGGYLFSHGQGNMLIYMGAAAALIATITIGFSRNVVSRGALS